MQLLDRGFTWMDAGTFCSLRRTTSFVCMIEEKNTRSWPSPPPEKIAYRFGWIDDAKMLENANRYGKAPTANIFVLFSVDTRERGLKYSFWHTAYSPCGYVVEEWIDRTLRILKWLYCDWSAATETVAVFWVSKVFYIMANSI